MTAQEQQLTHLLNCLLGDLGYPGFGRDLGLLIASKLTPAQIEYYTVNIARAGFDSYIAPLRILGALDNIIEPRLRPLAEQAAYRLAATLNELCQPYRSGSS